MSPKKESEGTKSLSIDWPPYTLEQDAVIDLMKLPRQALPDPNPDTLTTPVPSRETKAVSRPPLLPASMLLKRLKNDPAFDAGKYEVGYGDLGMLNYKLVKDWTSDTSAEEFIPENRI